jgi:hypothetical protein
LAAQRFPLLGQHPKRCSRCGPESLEQPSLCASQAPRTSEFGLNGAWLENASNPYLPWKSVPSVGIHFPFKVKTQVIRDHIIQ